MVYSCVAHLLLLHHLSFLFFFDQVASTFRHGPHVTTTILVSLLELYKPFSLVKAYCFEFVSELLLSLFFWCFWILSLHNVLMVVVEGYHRLIQYSSLTLRNLLNVISRILDQALLLLMFQDRDLVPFWLFRSTFAASVPFLRIYVFP